MAGKFWNYANSYSDPPDEKFGFRLKKVDEWKKSNQSSNDAFESAAKKRKDLVYRQEV